MGQIRWRGKPELAPAMVSAFSSFDFEPLDQVLYNATETNHRAYMLPAPEVARPIAGEEQAGGTTW